MDLVSIVLAELEWYRKSYLFKSLSAVLCSGLLVNVCGIHIKSLYSDKGTGALQKLSTVTILTRVSDLSLATNDHAATPLLLSASVSL